MDEVVCVDSVEVILKITVTQPMLTCMRDILLSSDPLQIRTRIVWTVVDVVGLDPVLMVDLHLVRIRDRSMSQHYCFMHSHLSSQIRSVIAVLVLSEGQLLPVMLAVYRSKVTNHVTRMQRERKELLMSIVGYTPLVSEVVSLTIDVLTIYRLLVVVHTNHLLYLLLFGLVRLVRIQSC